MSIPTSPNLSAEYPNVGTTMSINRGVRMTYFLPRLYLKTQYIAMAVYKPYRTGAVPSETRTFQVAKTSRPLSLTVDAARASFALRAEMMDAAMKMGAFMMIPGRAMTVHALM